MSGVTQQNGRNNRSLGELIKENQLLKTRFRRKSISSVYMRMKQHRQNLPAWGYQENILSSIADNQVVIIQGMTGCGKSTQVQRQRFFRNYESVILGARARFDSIIQYEVLILHT